MNNKRYYHFQQPETLQVGTKAIIPLKDGSKKEAVLREMCEDHLFFVDTEGNDYHILKEELFDFQYLAFEYEQ